MMKVSSVQSGFDQARLKRIEPWMQRYVDERKYAGSSLLILQGGTQVYAHTAGHRDVAAGLPFERDTIARIYSMTKPITSVAMMMLVERGLMHLDAPVSEFIPAFADMQALVPGAKRIDQTAPCATPTLHHLMTHTSGLTYEFNPGPVSEAMREKGILFDPDGGRLGDMVDRLAQMPLAFEPGSRWEYSVGIDVIGRVIEIVSGKPLGQFFADEVFAPLGMSETGFSVPAGTGDRFAALYTSLDGDTRTLDAAIKGSNTLRLVERAEGSPFQAATMHAGGAGLVGTIDDYMQFVEMMRRGGECNGERLIGSGTLDFMMRNHLPGEIASMGPQSFAEQPMEGMGFGLGGAVVLNPARARTPGSVGDFAWGGLASTFFWTDRSRELSVVFFTQLTPSSSYPTRAELKALVHGAFSHGSLS